MNGIDTRRGAHWGGLSLGLGLLLAGACAPESSGTFGPYDPSAYGRTDCAFSVKVENGGACPRIPIPTIAVPGVASPERKPPEKGCNLYDYARNVFVCPPPEIAPGEEVVEPQAGERYCYHTLAKVECYDRPASDPNRHPVSIGPNTPGIAAPIIKP